MAKKVYTLSLDEKNLQSSVSHKSAVDKKKTCAQKEVEEFGIVEINNAGASKKVKNNKEVGYEKVVSCASKKQVKENIHQVDDYFDFSFRPEKQVVKESKKEEAKVITKPAKKVEAKATAKKSTKPALKETEVIIDNSKKTVSAPSINPKHIAEVKTYKMEETSPERTIYDDAACYNISVARMGALFDCEKRMLN